MKTKRRNRSQFEPELVINAATVKYALEAFRQVLPVLPKDCIISDIASVKTGLKKILRRKRFPLCVDILCSALLLPV